MCVDDVLMEFGFGLEWTRVAVIPSAEKRLRHFGLDVQTQMQFGLLLLDVHLLPLKISCSGLR